MRVAVFFLSVLFLIFKQGHSRGLMQAQQGASLEVSQTIIPRDSGLVHSRLEILKTGMRRISSRPKHEDKGESFEVVEEEDTKEAPSHEGFSLLMWCSLMAGILLLSLPVVYYRKRSLSK